MAIARAAQLQPQDVVLEIGPGTGNLTRLLLPQVQLLWAVEVDRDLCDRFRRQGMPAHFRLLEQDVLTLDLGKLDPKPHKVVANIPYNITGEILRLLLGTIAQPNPLFERVVLLVQAEIAERLTAQPSTKAYGALSVRVQYLADCTWVCAVPPQSFSPPPKVDSAVVCLAPRPPQRPARDPKLFDQLLTLGFATRRKMLRNTLSSVVSREHLLGLLQSFAINPNARAEDLAIPQWLDLVDALHGAPAANGSC
jgi:16S rRNA (adenine1518-N6/adenine1519-N6)-dimethyltransferase